MSIENKWFAMSPSNPSEDKPSSAEISIYDQIGGFGVSANDFIDELKELGDVEQINLRISSGGGSIVEGNTIFNALKRHGAKVITHVDSLAASMASVIAMAGDEIHMAENALLMIHTLGQPVSAERINFAKTLTCLTRCKPTFATAMLARNMTQKSLMR